jgi:hypothetical protein
MVLLPVFIFTHLEDKNDYADEASDESKGNVEQKQRDKYACCHDEAYHSFQCTHTIS